LSLLRCSWSLLAVFLLLLHAMSVGLVSAAPAGLLPAGIICSSDGSQPHEWPSPGDPADHGLCTDLCATLHTGFVLLPQQPGLASGAEPRFISSVRPSTIRPHTRNDWDQRKIRGPPGRETKL
jgi:hypothetical protein